MLTGVGVEFELSDGGVGVLVLPFPTGDEFGVADGTGELVGVGVAAPAVTEIGPSVFSLPFNSISMSLYQYVSPFTMLSLSTTAYSAPKMPSPMPGTNPIPARSYYWRQRKRWNYFHLNM